MIAPPAEAIRAAELAAAKSPCAKSKRGVVTFALKPSGLPKLQRELESVQIIGEGWNGPPSVPFARNIAGQTCDGSADCRADCGRRCVHAEMRAMRGGTSLQRRIYAPFEMVHVKLGFDGKVLPGGGPSCWQCSREIVDCGLIKGVWLYIAPTISVELANVPEAGESVPAATWRYFTADEFHRATLEACGIGGPR